MPNEPFAVQKLIYAFDLISSPALRATQKNSRVSVVGITILQVSSTVVCRGGHDGAA